MKIKIKCPLEIETEHGCICEGATTEQNWTVCRPRECKVAELVGRLNAYIEYTEVLENKVDKLRAKLKRKQEVKNDKL